MKNKQSEMKKIDCEEAIARFNDFMDNYLKGISRNELTNHIAECQGCMKRFEFEQLLKSKVQELAGTSDAGMKNRIEKLIASL